jgi:membrane protease YdiL (CAAX protease family)
MMFLVQLVFLLAENNKDAYFLFKIMVANQIVFIAVTYIYLSYRKINPVKSAGFNRKLNAKQILMLPLITALTLAASAPLAMIFAYILLKTGYVSDAALPDIYGLKNFIAAFVVIAVLPPIGEEFLFRNAVMKGLKKRGYVFAMIVSSILFSLMHASPEQLIHQFFVGMVLAFVMLVTGNLLAPMLIHFCNNFFALLLEYTPFNKIDLSKDVLLAILIGMTLIFSVLLIIALKRFLVVERVKRNANISDTEKRNFINEYFYTNAVLGGLDYETSIEDKVDDVVGKLLDGERSLSELESLYPVKFAILGSFFMVVTSLIFGYFTNLIA